MKTATSKDGTKLAYEEVGAGPPLLLVDGAFCGREFGPSAPLAALLQKSFRVVYYDRRGRGASQTTAPYALEREIEDVACMLEVLGGKANVYGVSSGAALAMRAAGAGLGVERLVVYEPPFALDGTHTPSPADYREQVGALLREDRRDDAVKLFMRVVGVPGFAIFLMRLFPNVWPKLRAAAPTLTNDFAALGETQSGGPLPDDLRKALAAIRAPTLAASGGKSPPWMHHAAKTVAASIPGATHEVVPKQDHNVAAKAIAPLLERHFRSAS